MVIKLLIKELDSLKCRSHWDNAVREDAVHLLENFDGLSDFTGSPADCKKLLNGASNWKEYSYGGCYLCYNYDLAKHYCTPSEFKKTKEGMRNPNSYETWLDVQARALFQAERLILRTVEKNEQY